jgi:hypothetical protein
MPTAPATTLQ